MAIAPRLLARSLTVAFTCLLRAGGNNHDEFSAYRLRLAHGSQPPSDPYKINVADHWQVREIAFTSDAACQTTLAVKASIASAGATKASLAFDGSSSTRWSLACIVGEDPIDRCRKSWTDGAWIGAELHSPAVVKCITLDHTVSIDGLVLDGWSSFHKRWLALQEFGPVPGTSGFFGTAKLRRLHGGACGDPGTVADTSSANSGMQVWLPSCASRSQWRFVSTEASSSWVIFEFELYRDAKCRDRAQNGVPITSDDQPEPARRMHDGRLSTAWTASCPEGAGKGACQKGLLWAGLSFPRSEDIKCVRVYQTHEATEKAGEFSLSTWNGTAWVVSQKFSAVQNNEWVELSQVEAKGSRYRLVNHGKIEAAWAVHELTFMRNPTCTQATVGGLPISSGTNEEKAFDGSIDTVWVSQCAPCEPGMAYIGQTFASFIPVQCIQLRQGGDFEYIPNSVRLEAWTNVSNSYRWKEVRIYTQLVGGLNVLSRWWGYSGTRFIISNLDSAPGGWRVAELRLFSKEDCSGRITGMPFGNDADPADADRALDGVPESFWHASCCPKLSQDTECMDCDGIGAWVGIISLSNTTVNCLQILQKGVPQPRGPMHHAAKSIALKGWDGERFTIVSEWEGIPGDEWVELKVGVAYSADAVTCKDNRDWEKCNSTGWNCTYYKEEDMCNETFLDDVDCGGVSLSFACQEACCLCGENNADHCPKEAEKEAGLPFFVIPVAAGGGGTMLLSCLISCIAWKKRTCHKKRGCGSCCRILDRCARRSDVG